jgi:iron complex outermembrane receptor protein
MFEASLNFRKAILGSASVLAISMATPAFAQDAPAAPSSDQPPPPKVTPNQIQGPIGPAQVRTGAADSGEIVITGIRASIQASLNRKKQSDIVSEVITAQDIGKFPDKNVADSLGRLTGVNVVTGSSSAGGFSENQNVSIRGTDPTLNLTLLDGHGIATGDWFVLDQTAGGRSFDYSLLPSEIVGSLEVYKASEADLPEGGIGGTINVHSREPLDLPAGTISLSAQTNYNDLANKWAPWLSGLVSWKNAEGTVGILGSAFYEKEYLRRDGQEVLGYTSYANFAGTGQSVAVPNEIGSSYFRQERIRKGGTLALQFRPSPAFELDLNGLYSRLDANNINTNGMSWLVHVAGGNSTPGSPTYALAPGFVISNGYLTSATWNPTDASGNPVAGRLQDDIYRQAYSSTWDVNADATWHISDRAKLTGQAGYTEGKGATTDTYAWETYWNTGVSYQLGNGTASNTFTGLPADFTSPAYLHNFYNWSWGGHIVSPDREFYARADLEYDFGGSFFRSIKVGARYSDHKRSLDYIAYAWPGNGLFSGTQLVNLGTVFGGGVTPSNYGNGLTGVEPYSFSDQNLVLQELATNGGRQFAFYPQASFSVTEKTDALYAMARFDDDSHWRGNIGVRAVRTNQDSLQYSPNAPVANTVTIFCGTCGTVDVKRSYWDVLPSANVTYSVQPDLLLRAGVAKVITRPGYAQLASSITVNETNFTATSSGNPYLDPYAAWNYNAAVEWYYGKQSLLSVNVFYLKILNYLTTADFHEFLRTQQHPDGHDFTVTGPVNGGGGTNKGFEINWQQPIAYGFGVIANYTYADAKRDNGLPIDGNSRNTYNLTGYFEDSLLSARLAYTYRSKFQSGFDRGVEIWQGNYGSLDGSLTVNLTKNFALTADAHNLFNRHLHYYVGTPTIPLRTYNNGRTFWLGAKATFGSNPPPPPLPPPPQHVPPPPATQTCADGSEIEVTATCPAPPPPPSPPPAPPPAPERV